MSAVQQIAAAKQAAGFKNVPESWTLHDTILITGYKNSLDWNDGYFESFSIASAAQNYPFFNVRNSNHHLAYNNQDTRDQMPYAFEAWSLGVDFWAPQLQTQFSGDPVDTAYSQMSAVWQCDMPRHAAISFHINQDERLKTQVCIASPGMGPVGGGVSQGIQGDIQAGSGGGVGVNPIKGITSMGQAGITNRWKFPNPLMIPRRAAIAAEITLSEYGRQLLANMPGPFYNRFFDTANDSILKWSCFGITVSLTGKRLVQQRGKYHA